MRCFKTRITAAVLGLGPLCEFFGESWASVFPEYDLCGELFAFDSDEPPTQGLAALIS